MKCGPRSRKIAQEIGRKGMKSTRLLVGYMMEFL